MYFWNAREQRKLIFSVLTSEKEVLSDRLSHKNTAAPPHIYILHLQQQKESARDKQLSFDSSPLTPEGKKNHQFSERGGKRKKVILSSTGALSEHSQSFRYCETLRKLSELYREVLMNTFPSQWRKNIWCYPFLHEANHQWSGWSYWPSSILSALSKLWKEFCQNIWCAFTFGAAWLLPLETQQRVFLLDLSEVAALLCLK